MKIATFNVNSLRARLHILIPWLEKNKPDILAIQETKVRDADFPAEPFEKLDYYFAFKGQKKYNGVAILSRYKIDDVQTGFDSEPKDQTRLIKAKIKNINVVNTYVPQGFMRDSDKFEYKLAWFDRLADFFKHNFKLSEPLVWTGDFNVAPEAKDVYDPEILAGHVCFCPEVTKALNKVTKWGFLDLFRMHCKDPGQYTFWDYRLNAFKQNRGWRIDHIMTTKHLAQKCKNCYIDKNPRAAQKPSDHTPLIAEVRDV